MSLIGKLHEISLYGLICAIVCLIEKKVTTAILWNAKFEFATFNDFFFTYMFWASVAFIPIAIIGGICTRVFDDGEGLTFGSDNVFVIVFAHIAEDILGLILTPIWFIKDLVTGELEGFKVIDYILWVIEIAYIALNMFFLFKK